MIYQYIYIYQWWSCPNVEAYHSQIGEIELDRGLIPAVPLALKVQIRRCMPQFHKTPIQYTIETKPRNLGWRRTLIISLVVN